MLTPEQLAAREGKLTASRVACLKTGDEAEITALWKEMIGDPSFVPEDFSDNWPMALGSATEQLQLDWFERKHGVAHSRGEVFVGTPDWQACTLDGWSAQYHCPIECKHVGGREPLATIIDRYQPQMHWQMIVTQATRCILSVIEGANAPVIEFIEKSESYAKELLLRANAFMLCVETLTPPVAQKPVAPPVIPAIEYDMQGRNEWASNAADWLANVNAKKIAENAEKELKALVPADAVRCFGHSVEIKRARNGNLSLRREKQ